MRKLTLLSSFFLFFSLFLINSAEARSGCCSHHGGVCGCGCCDGTSLSTTCAPYYPSCSSDPVEPEYIEKTSIIEEVNNVPVYKAAAVMSSAEANNSNTVSPAVEDNPVDNSMIKEITPIIEQPKQTLDFQDTAKIENNIKTEQAPLVPASENKKNENDDGGFWGGLIFWGVVGYMVYLIKKKKDNKK